MFEIPISTLNERSLEGLDMTSKQKDLTKNFFALGIMFWLYERSMDPTLKWIDTKFGAKPVLVTGMSLLVAGALWYTQIDVDGSYQVDLLPGFLAVGIEI